MPLANPITRLFFPRSCINQLLESFAPVSAMWREPKAITVEVQHNTTGIGATLYYQLNLDLTLKSLGIASNYEMTHHRLQDAGNLDHDLNDTESAALRNIACVRNTKQ